MPFRTVAMIAALGLLTAADDNVPTQRRPRGMDLLYGNRIALGADGEPTIPVGLMTGQRDVVVRGNRGLRVAFREAGRRKHTLLPAGAPVSVEVVQATPARRQVYLDLEGLPREDSDGLKRALAGWRARGYDDVQVIEEGVLLDIAGRTVDTRKKRLVLPAASLTEARRRARVLYDHYGVRAVGRSRLEKRPRASLRVRTQAEGLGIAADYVRLSPLRGGTVRVDGVEHGRGYAWHGREDRTYRGEIYVVVDPAGALAAVNVVPAGDILKSVVPSEMFASAPVEALKSQAVAARNVLLSKLGRAHRDAPFQLCSSQHCQVYSGMGREDPRTNAAVSETRGEALFLGDRLVHAVYSSTCGGHTEDNDVVWGGQPDPALRGRPDFDVQAHADLATYAEGLDDRSIGPWVSLEPAAYCAAASQAQPQKVRWVRHMKAAELGARVHTAYPQLGELVDLEVEDRGPGGRAVGLRLVGTGGEVTVLHELPIRKLLGNFLSAAFTVAADFDADGALAVVTFRGAGWGHGVGMCQLGAMGRAEARQGYRDILAHYYNGAETRVLYGRRDTLLTRR